MKLSELTKVNDYYVKQWLKESLNLTPYQIEKMGEMLEDSDFYFYEYSKEKNVSLLWRFTLPFFLIEGILLVCLNPVKWLFTGKWGYSSKFLDTFYYKWKQKLNL